MLATYTFIYTSDIVSNLRYLCIESVYTDSLVCAMYLEAIKFLSIRGLSGLQQPGQLVCLLLSLLSGNVRGSDNETAVLSLLFTA